MSGQPNTSPAISIPDADPRLYNHDLAPVAPAGRTWGVFSLFAMWMSDVHSVGGYTFAASLFFLGLTGWQVLIAMVAGITAVYFLINLIGRPSLKYGTPFPVVARMSFGVMGANIAASLRGIVGIVWYGVQTYFASKAVQALVLTFYPAAESLTHSQFIGLSALGWFSFLFMWIFQLLIFLNGMETNRFVVLLAVPWATGRRAKPGHDFEQVVDGGIWFHSSQDHQIVTVHHLGPWQLSRLNRVGTKFGNPACEFCAGQIANPHDISGGKIPFGACDSGRKQAPAFITQRCFRSLIDEQRAGRMVEKCDPTLPTAKLVWLR